MCPVLEKMIQSPILATVYPLSQDILCEYIRILHGEGYPALEVLSRPLDKALDVIRQINKRPERKLIALGIGTILNEKSAKEAIKLKPDFLVSPAFSRRVLHVAVKAGIPYIPGVRTFQDVQDVLEAFEDEGIPLRVLKLCPIEGLTLEYVQMLSGCYPGILFCPTGEVTMDNLSYWKSLPCIGPPMGSNFVPQEFLEKKDFDEVRACLRIIKKTLLSRKL